MLSEQMSHCYEFTRIQLPIMITRKLQLSLSPLSRCPSARGSNLQKKSFHHIPRKMLRKEQLVISSDSDAATVLTDASTLVDDGRWTLCNEGKGVERSFKFKGFKAAWVCDHLPQATMDKIILIIVNEAL